uniref:inhibitor of Bruton tyrosine kinase isoform X3 n=1 Tax=Myxine glutinosa TaxID=7769 RepID=UPI00358FE317
MNVQLVRCPHYPKVALSQFHSIFLTTSGAVYTCGHGTGGRLGHGDQASCLIPRCVKSSHVFISIAAGRDHSVLLSNNGCVLAFGLNTYRQLGAPREIELSMWPRRVNCAQVKTKVNGVAAGRYHTLLWTKEGVYTFGLNAGQLGHSKANMVSDQLIGSPRKVSALQLPPGGGNIPERNSRFLVEPGVPVEVPERRNRFLIEPRVTCATHKPEIVYTESCDGAAVCYVSHGELWLLSSYQCRKIRLPGGVTAVKNVAVCGGWLDPTVTSSQERDGSHVIITIVDASGKMFVWQENVISAESGSRGSNGRVFGGWSRLCFSRRGDVNVAAACVNPSSLVLVTEEKEAVIGKWAQRTVHSASSPQGTLKGGSSWEWSKSEPGRGIPEMRIPFHSLSHAHRAVSAVSDPRGVNFALLQILPRACLSDLPPSPPPSLPSTLAPLLSKTPLVEADIVFKGNFSKIGVHRFIIASRSEVIMQLLCEDKGVEGEAEPGGEDHGEDVAGPGSEGEAGPCGNVDCEDEALSGCDGEDEADASLDIKDEDEGDGTDRSCFGTEETREMEHYEKWLKDDPKEVRLSENGNDNISVKYIGSQNALNVCGFSRHTVWQLVTFIYTGELNLNGQLDPRDLSSFELRFLQRAAELFGLESLAERLNLINFGEDDGEDEYLKQESERIVFDRIRGAQFSDLVIRSCDGVLFSCHSCILVPRLEYFRAMTSHLWRQGISDDVLQLHIRAKVLSLLLDYLYSDFLPEIQGNDSVDLLCELLAASDQLMAFELKDACQRALVAELTLNNCYTLLRLSLWYGADLLTSVVQEFICKNLMSLIQLGLFETFDDEVLEELSAFYRNMIPGMAKRIISARPVPCSAVSVSPMMTPNFSNSSNSSVLSPLPDSPLSFLLSTPKNKKRNKTVIGMQSQNEKPVSKRIESNTETSRCVLESPPLSRSTSVVSSSKVSPDEIPSQCTAPKQSSYSSPIASAPLPCMGHHRKGQKDEEERADGPATSPLSPGDRWRERPWINSPPSAVTDLRAVIAMETKMQREDLHNHISARARQTHGTGRRSQKTRKTVKVEEQEELTNVEPSRPACPWAATSPVDPPVKFATLLEMEKEREIALTRQTHKPLALIQVEEYAIEQLLTMYGGEDCPDETITVQRSPPLRPSPTPIWNKT